MVFSLFALPACFCRAWLSPGLIRYSKVQMTYRMRRNLSSVLALAAVALALLILPTDGTGAETWLTYHNDRYGTTIDYPGSFKPQPPPDADDGRVFKSADGAQFLVSAIYNALDFDVAKYRDFVLKNLDQGAVVTYQASGADWFVVSGTKGTDIFYERHLLSHGGQMTEDFVISYPSALKATYDPIAVRMAKSFRSGNGFQSP
jgi:hypothetical protein